MQPRPPAPMRPVKEMTLDNETMIAPVDAPAATQQDDEIVLDDSGLPVGDAASEPIDEFEGEFDGEGFTPESTASSASSAQALSMDRRLVRLIAIGVLTNSTKFPLKVPNKAAANGKLRSVGKAIHGAADRAGVTVQCVSDGRFTYGRLITETPVHPDVTTTNPVDDGSES